MTEDEISAIEGRTASDIPALITEVRLLRKALGDLLGRLEDFRPWHEWGTREDQEAEFRARKALAGRSGK